MASSRTDKTCTNGGNNENEAPQAQKATVDASKLNDLMSNLDKRLAGGLHGDYYEKESKLDDKNRHGQLETVFGLRKELSEIKSQIEKQNQEAESDQPKTGKGAPQANKSMIATIKTVVQQELSEKLRDLSVRNERLEANVEKSSGRSEALETKVKALESKLKKTEERNQHLQDKLSGSYVKVLETKLKKVEADLAGLLIMHAGVEARLSLIEEKTQRYGELDMNRINRMQQTIARHETRLSSMSQVVDSLEAFRDEMNDYDNNESSSEDGYGW